MSERAATADTPRPRLGDDGAPVTGASAGRRHAATALRLVPAPVWVWVLSLLALLPSASSLPMPGSLDAYYYLGGAVQLARGHGLNEPYLWSYFAATPSLPAPSHLYWLPLTSLLMSPFIWLGDALNGGPLPLATAWRWAQAPLLMTAAGLGVLAYALGCRWAQDRWRPWLCALVTVFSIAFYRQWADSDAFGLFALLAGASLWWAGDADAGRGWRPALAAGASAALAALTRNDGLLLLAVLGCAPFVHPSLRTQRVRWWLGVLAGFGVVYAPWLLRNLLAIGSLTLPTSSRALWLVDYNDLFLLDPLTITFARWWATGWAAITAGWGSALEVVLAHLAVAVGNVTLLPFAVAGLMRWRRDPLAVLVVLHLVGLALVSVFVFPHQATRGLYAHSAPAHLAFVSALGLAGIDVVVRWVARRLPHWNPERSVPVFSAAVAGMIVLGAVAQLVKTRFQDGAGQTPPAAYDQIGAFLARSGVPADAVVMSNMPPAFWYFSGHPGIPVPNGGLPEVDQAMARYGAEWLVLDVNVVPALEPVFERPELATGFSLRATFTDPAGLPVYVLERVSAAEGSP